MCCIVVIKVLRDSRRVMTVVASLIAVSRVVQIVDRVIKGIFVARVSFKVKEEWSK